jgi:hypothetical protein
VNDHTKLIADVWVLWLPLQKKKLFRVGESKGITVNMMPVVYFEVQPFQPPQFLIAHGVYSI